MLEMKT